MAKVWGLLTKITHHGYKEIKKIYNQMSKEEEVTEGMRKRLFMASHITEMKQLLILRLYLQALSEEMEL